MSWFSDRPERLGRPAILLAGIPSEDDLEVTLDAVLEIEEAVLSFVRAVLAAGHRLIVIADSSLAALAAVVAGEYAGAARAERDKAPWLVEILESGRESDSGDSASAAGLNGVGRTHFSGEPGSIALDRDAIAFMAVGHVHPTALRSLMSGQLAPGMLMSTIPPSTLDAFGPGDLDEADIVAHEAEVVSALAEEGGPLPMAYLMQRFVSRWPDDADEPWHPTRVLR